MLLNYHIGRFFLVSLCVGDLLRLGLSISMLQADVCNTQAPDDGYINVRNILST